jgi:hypothetical protein
MSILFINSLDTCEEEGPWPWATDWNANIQEESLRCGKCNEELIVPEEKTIEDGYQVLMMCPNARTEHGHGVWFGERRV